MTRIYLTMKSDISDNIVTAGVITEQTRRGETGYIFHPFSQNGRSRTLKVSAEAAIPRKFNGYIVEAESPLDADTITADYRDGVIYAAEAALRGEIRMVRNGRIA